LVVFDLRYRFIAERFAGRSEQGQQRDRKRVQQPQAVAPLETIMR
jgi:hypothetical protein